MKYSWDIKKEKSNISKRGISFTEAQEALDCGLVVVLKEDYSQDEQRFVFLGMCKRLNILVVVVAYPEEDTTRIISA